jgi:aspartate aminotransferase/aminotransferase
MKSLSNVIKTMPESGIRKVYALAENAADCIHLEIGEPNFVTPQYICDAAIKAMAEGMTKYMPMTGYPSLRESIAAEYSQKYGMKIDPSEVAVTSGAVMAIFDALRVISEPGDEILIPDPCWPVYRMQLHALSLEAVPYLLDERNFMQPTKAGIEQLISPKTKAIVVNSPSNPAGVVFDKETVQMIMDIAKTHDLYIISDEIYDFLTYDGKRHISFKPYDEDGRVILISGASKKYAMPGWRVGFAIANKEIIYLIEQFMIVKSGSCSSIAQKAFEGAISGPQDFVQESVESYCERRNAIVRICEKAKIPLFIPQGAFYLWLDISGTKMDADQFLVTLFEKHRVTVTPGTTFGASGKYRIRISFATEMDALCKGVQSICDLINSKS